MRPTALITGILIWASVLGCGGSSDTEHTRILRPEYLSGTKSFAAGVYIPLTMEKLQSGDEVRILFYGQSISEQDWIWRVIDYLEMKFPAATIIADEHARAAWEADRLVTVYKDDVFSWDPDLVIFHVFGDRQAYETIVHGIRSHVNGRNQKIEMLITNDHVCIMYRNDLLDSRSWEWLPSVCHRLDCGFVDVRTPWYNVLEIEYDGDAQALLIDNVHLNNTGNQLYADLVEGYFPN